MTIRPVTGLIAEQANYAIEVSYEDLGSACGPRFFASKFTLPGRKPIVILCRAAAVVAGGCEARLRCDDAGFFAATGYRIQGIG